MSVRLGFKPIFFKLRNLKWVEITDSLKGFLQKKQEAIGLWINQKKYKDPKELRKLSMGSLVMLLLLGFWFSIPGTLFQKPTSWVLEGSKGELLGASLAADHQWRFPPGKKLPQKFKDALVHFEDKRFYHHPGVDIFSIIRAVQQNFKYHKIKSGGSTITMQVIRLYRQKPRTYLEKIWEIILAIRLELSYSKEEILQLYADNAPFGSNIVGLEAASWRYFGRSAENLSWAESCVLAVLPNNPNWVRPGKNQFLLEEKRNQVLASLKKDKIISSETYSLAKEEPLPGKPHELPNLAPHLLEFSKKQTSISGKTSTLIHSTLHTDLQIQVNELLQQEINRLNANYIHNAAILVLDIESGSVMAYAGNIVRNHIPDFEQDVDVIQSPRSPGSTLKPLLYASMIQEGYLLPHSLVADIPTNFAGYTPQNFDLGYDGAVPASKALSRSLNVPAVRMLYDYTYPHFYDQLKKLGFTTLNHPADFYGLSLILGGEEIKLWDLCGVYASLARTLNHSKNHPGLFNKDDFHPPIFSKDEMEHYIHKSPELTKERILGASSIWYTFQAMEEVQRPGDESFWRNWSSSQRIAWKTGTSFGFRDAWAIGLNSRFVVGVWVGNTTGEGRPGILGIRAAAPILFSVFRHIPSSPWFSFPDKESIGIKVCKLSGFKAGEYCTETQIMDLPIESNRAPICPFHLLEHFNADKTYRINADCPGANTMVHEPWFVLPPTMEWFYKLKNPFYKTLPPLFPGCPNGVEENSPIGMIYPDNMAKIYLPIDIDGKRGKVVFKASQRGNSGILFWHLDKEYIGSTNRFHEMALSPAVGHHILTLEDQQGNTFQRSFDIIEPKNN